MEELRPRAEESPLIQPPFLLFHINGPAGVGKKTLIRRIWSEIAKGEVPRILFTLRAVEEKIVEKLISDALANRSYLQDAITEIGGEIEAQSKRLADAGRPLPEEARLTLWFDLVEQKLVEEGKNNRDLQLIFALPDFFALPQPLREAVARGLPRANEGVDCRVIVTSPSSSTQEEIQKLFPERTPIDDMPLAPLDIDNVGEWLQANKIQLDYTDEIYKRSGGLPGNLEHVASDVVREHQEKILILLAQETLKDTPENMQRQLCAAALLPEITQQTLQILMTPEESAATMQYLRVCDWPDSGWRGTAFVAGDNIRKSLAGYMLAKFKPDYGRCAPLASEFGKIGKLLPTAELRDTLVALSPFNYFNEALLRELMPERAEAMISLVHANPSLFEFTSANYKLKSETRQAVEAYAKLAKIVMPTDLKPKISSAWEARRRSIMDQMTTSEDKIKRNTDTFSTLQTQIKQIAGEIDSELGKLTKYRRRNQGRTEETTKSKTSGRGLQIGRLAMQGVGTIIIYISILLSSKESLIYAAFGVGLIIGGLFVKGGMLAPVRATVRSGLSMTDDIEKHERSLHFLNIKKSQLESRQNLVAGNIAKEKSALKEFDKQLREPYS
jgi:hypothetical protein